MKHEFWAEFDLFQELSENEWRNKSLLDGIVGKTSEGLPDGWNDLDDFSRLQLLAAALASHKNVKWRDDRNRERKVSAKDYARTGALQYKEKSGLLYWYYEGDYQNFLRDGFDRMQNLNLNDLPNLSLFPPGSWAVQLTFILRKPYLSKDDVDFYILDNPVKKEWVFKVPYAAPSQWKGALRAAMVRDLVDALRSGKKNGKNFNEKDFVEERLRLYRLFGNEKDGTADFLNRAWALYRVGPRPEDGDQAQKWERRFQETVKQVASEFESRLREKGYRVGDIEGFQGRLHFYPTFFDRIGLEVINPHPRDTGAGKHPIYFESVPAGTQGVFTLLYVPLDLSDNPDEAQKQAAEDLKAVAQGICAMLTEYGFGAKTSSGFGVAEVAEVAEVEEEGIQVNPESWREIFWQGWEETCQDTSTT